MRFILILLAIFAFVLPSRAANPSDARLTKLMVGFWQSPRHRYIYLPDGTWYMGKVDPSWTHGTWRIEDRVLIENDFMGESHYPIQKLTRREIIYDGYHMKRIKKSELNE